MSEFRRRMMLQKAQSEPLPRERIVFSHAGDEIFSGGLKLYDGEALFGIVILHQTYYSSYRPYWFFSLALTKSGTDGNTLRIDGNGTANGAGSWFTGSDGLIHRQSTTNWNTRRSFFYVEDGIENAKEININNLPILNELTRKTYEGTWSSGGAFQCQEAAEDLLDYYYGVI